MYFSLRTAQLGLSFTSKLDWSVYKVSIARTAFNPYLASVPILYPLKTPENLWFSGVFRGYKMGTLARNGLKMPTLK